MSAVIEWNGKDVPAEFRRLPPGRYVVEELDEAPDLTPEEQEGLRAGLASIKAGRVRPWQEILGELRKERP